MYILNHNIVEEIARSDNETAIGRLDVWLMQWYNSTDGLKSYLLQSLAELYREVK